MARRIQSVARASSSWGDILRCRPKMKYPTLLGGNLKAHEAAPFMPSEAVWSLAGRGDELLPVGPCGAEGPGCASRPGGVRTSDNESVASAAGLAAVHLDDLQVFAQNAPDFGHFVVVPAFVVGAADEPVRAIIGQDHSVGFESL